MKKVILVLFLFGFSINAQAVDLSQAYGEKTMEEKLKIYKEINDKLSSDEKKQNAVNTKLYEEEEEETVTTETITTEEVSAVPLEAASSSSSESDEGTISKYWNKFKHNTSETWNNPTNYNVMVPFYAWHNRLAYDKEHIEKYNEEAWGLGFAMSRYDADDDWHSLYAMAFKDSNSYLETMFGYAYQSRHYFDDDHKWFAGAGFTLGLTQRHEYSYIPVPLPLPMFSLGHRNFNVNMAYVPGISNDGNVAFFFTNIEF
ncbi:MAG: lipid IV(A) palmitoyltransferase PagP [Alphaproteobacteria bacterium]